VTNHEDQLREAFAAHENLGPDPAEVYARVQELARGYRWRRRGAQAAGGVVLGAGLIAGAVNLPALLPGTPHDNVAIVAGAPGPSPSVSPSTTEQERDWAAYFAAGYGYTDATKLAQLWHMTGDIGTVKAEAGRRLLAGETLPISPGPEASEPPTTTAPDEDRDVNAYFAAGYTYDDAVTLSRLWHTPDPYSAKVEGGRRLLAGQALPIRP
jgi:hypothetical protein